MRTPRLPSVLGALALASLSTRGHTQSDARPPAGEQTADDIETVTQSDRGAEGIPPAPQPAARPEPGADPGSAAPPTSADPDLMAAVETAAAADTTQITASRGGAAHRTAGAVSAATASPPPPSARGWEIAGNEANPAFSLILDTVFAYFSTSDRYRFGGHAPTSNGPAIQGAELAASAAVDPYFEIDAAFGLYHLHLEEIYATTTALPWNLQARAGKFKADVGRHNPTHLHSWHFVVHPIANGFLFGAEGLGLPGVEISFLFPFPWYVEFKGALQLGEAGMFRSKAIDDPDFRDFIYPIRLVQFFDISDDIGLQLGINTVLGPSAIGPEVGNRSFAYGADLLLKWRPIGQGSTGYTFIAWVTEAWFREMSVAGAVWRDIGGYSDIIFGIAKRWQAALRGELWRQIGAESDAEENRARFGADTVRGVLSASFLPSHFSRLRLQYDVTRMKGFDDSHAVMLQLEVSAGAHGAHKY